MGLYYREKFKNGAEIVVWEITETEEQFMQICALPNDEEEELSFPALTGTTGSQGNP